jgi:phosphate-selective porin OprO/OprP
MSLVSAHRHRRALIRLSRRALAIAALGTLALPFGARAQSAAGGQSAPPVVAGWQNGFFVQSADGSNKLSFGTVIQEDGRFSVDDPSAFTNTFTLRKARLGIQGQVAKYFAFRLTPELGNGAATVVDAYADVRFSPAFSVRVGKDKTPVGLELLYGDAGLYFNERSLVSLLVPNRDDGVQIRGDVARGAVSYAIGVFNGVPDGSSTTTDVDTNGGKDVAGRIQVRPFHRTGATAGSALDNFGLHLGVSSGSQTGALPSFKTSAGQRFFTYAGANADGDRTRLSPGIFYYYKSLGVFGEYARTSQDVTKADVTGSVTNEAWDASGTVILTGETASNGVIRPRRPFDPASGAWGAVEIVARYAVLTVDDDAFTLGFASDDAVREAHQGSVGVNWYPVSLVKFYLSYERTSFDGGAAERPVENAVFFRTQLAF